MANSTRIDEPSPPTSRSMTSNSLLDQIRRHDQEGWRNFVALYSPIVYGWCRRWGMQQTDAQDVTQDVFRAVFGGIHGFRKDDAGATFRGWLWTVARSKASSHFSQLASNPQATGGTELQMRLANIAETYSGEWIGDEITTDSATLMSRALEAICGDFQANTWQAFLRTTVDGQSAVDVATELQMTSRAVRQAKHRVLQRLREQFGELLE